VTGGRRAVVTGLGVIAPCGTGPAAFWHGLSSLAAAPARRVSYFDATPLPVRIAYELPDFDPKKTLGKEHRKGLNKMARTVQLGFAAAMQMWDAGLCPKPAAGEIAPERFGVEFACVMVATELDDLAGGAKVAADHTPGTVDLAKWGTDGLRAVPPQWMLKYLPNMPACHTSVVMDARGPNNTVTCSDTAGLVALGEAYRLIGRGWADYFLVGGCESKVNPVSFTRHATFQELSRRNDAPTEALRPFDAHRAGTVLGEAACTLGLEEAGHAAARGAAVLGEVVGFASGFARRLDPDRFATVIRKALTEAKVSPADVDHVNAGAGGYRTLDAFEARAIRQVFGDVPVFAPRGHVGSTGAASGLVELAASLLALRHGTVPATLNHAAAGDDCPVRVTREPRPARTPVAVKLSCTDLGQVAAVVVRAEASRPRQGAEDNPTQTTVVPGGSPSVP
jgi:3-oxoacyl-[acyl-carrier-protein] synthase II